MAAFRAFFSVTLLVVAAHGSLAQVDLQGDPLPEGAVARLGTTRLRHAGNVFDVKFSKDGKSIVTTGGDFQVRVWATATGQQIAKFESNGEVLQQMQFGPDGNFLAIHGSSVVRLDAKTGLMGKEIVKHPSAITKYLLSPTGKVIASISRGFQQPVEVRVTELATGKALLKLNPSADKFVIYGLFGSEGMAFSPDESLLLISAADETIQAWKIVDQTLKYELNQEPWIGAHWQITPDGQSIMAMTGGDKSKLFVWDIATGKERYQLTLGSWHRSYFMPDGKTFLVSGNDEPITVHDAATGKQLRALTTRAIDLVSISRDGQTLALGHGNLMGNVDQTKLQFVKYPSGEELKEISTKDFAQSDHCERSYILSPDARSIGLVANGKTTWGCGTGGEGVWFGSSSRAQFELRSTLDGRCIVRRVYPRSIHPNEWPGSTQLKLKFSPDASQAVLFGSLPAVKIWETATGREVTGDAGHEGAIREIAIPQHGTLLAALDGADAIFVWDRATSRKISELPKTGLQILRMVMSPDGRNIAALETLDNWIEVITIWDASSGQIVSRIARKFRYGMHPNGYPRLESISFPDNDTIWLFGTDGKKLASCRVSLDKAKSAFTKTPAQENARSELAKLVMLDDLAPLKPISAQASNGWVAQTITSPDLMYIAEVFGIDRNAGGLRVIDSNSGKTVFELPTDARPRWISRVAFLSGRDEIAFSGDFDNKYFVETWNITTGKMVKRLDKFNGQAHCLEPSSDGNLLGVATPKERIYSEADKEKRFPGHRHSELQVWDLAKDQLILHRTCVPIQKLMFSTDGKQIISGNADTTIMVWSVGLKGN